MISAPHLSIASPLVRAISYAVFSAALAATPANATVSLATASADLQAGKADEAIAILQNDLKSDPNSAEANNLLCRVEFTLQQFDRAASDCEKAVNLNPQNARYHLWLGRAIGERASRASFLSAFSMAKKTREEFETAARLDPRDPEVLTDLGQFYQEAPGAVGGGMDKADTIAKQLEDVDAARGHDLLGDIAEKRKDLATAEQEFKSALTGAAHPAFQWMKLASFYRRRERWSDMESALNSGYAAAKGDKHSVVALTNGASILARANRQLDLAVKLYETYIASPDKTEEVPAVDVHIHLARLYKQMGDQATAEREKAAALALAHEYKPALDFKP